MDTIFINSENSKTSEYHVLVVTLTDKLDLRRGQKAVALSNFSIYYTWKIIKSSYNNNKFKISAPTWNEEFELPDGSYSISDIQDYFKYILKKHSESVDNPSIRTYVNRIENRITFKNKNGYYLELLTPEAMKLLGSTENIKNKDKNGENVPRLEVGGLEYWFIAILLIMTISKIQEYYMLLYQTSHSVAYYKFHPKMASF